MRDRAGLDPLVVDDTDEQALLRATVSKIARGFGHAYFADCAARGESASALWAALADGGFVGVNVEARFGGGGMGISELAIVEEELAATGCPLMMLVVSPAIAAPMIERFGTEEQQNNWLPGLAAGTTKVAFAFTEPDAGSNAHRVALSATPASSGSWALRGTKHYISGADEADAILVVARTAWDAESERARLSLFLVPSGSPGLQMSVIPVEVKAAERQWTLFFDDVVVGAECLLGVEGDGLRQLFHGLNPERILSASVCTGLGRYALDKAAAYAVERNVWGRPIGAHQGVAHPLARAAIALEGARVMNRRAAARFDAGHEVGDEANMAKFAAAEAASLCLDVAIQVHGGHGLSTEYGLADLWGLVRLYGIAPVTREMVLNHVAQHVLGLPRSY